MLVSPAVRAASIWCRIDDDEYAAVENVAARFCWVLDALVLLTFGGNTKNVSLELKVVEVTLQVTP